VVEEVDEEGTAKLKRINCVFSYAVGPVFQNTKLIPFLFLNNFFT
jgi:hypothetical protein